MAEGLVLQRIMHGNKNRKFALILVLLVHFTFLIIVPNSVNAISANSWIEKAPMHVARSDLGVSVIDGKIYAIGGCTANGFIPNSKGNDYKAKGWITNINEEYDPTTDMWTFKSPMPTSRYQFAIASYQNKIYCFGGILNWASGNTTYTGVNEVYDPATDIWETKTPMPIITCAQAHVLGDKIYLIGGRGPNGTVYNQVYDPISDSWSIKAPVPIVPYNQVSATTQNKIYLIAYTQDLENFVNSKTFVYDPIADNWSYGAPVPSNLFKDKGIPWRGNWWSEGAGATSGVFAPIRVYVFFKQYVSYLPLPNLGYNPDANCWDIVSDAPTERQNFGVAILNDRLYLIGGYSTYYPAPDDANFEITPLAINEEYTPVGYGASDPSYLSPEAIIIPRITVTSPINQTYERSSLSLNFTVNKNVDWIVYSLDGKENITITGNMILTDLPNGLHNITIYAKDTFGNTGASETIAFTISAQPFPTTPIIAASTVSVVVACIGIGLYWQKRKQP